MPRVKRGTVRRAKRKKLLKRAKGFYATKSKLYQAAQEAVAKADNYAVAAAKSATSGNSGSSASTRPHARTASPTAS